MSCGTNFVTLLEREKVKYQDMYQDMRFFPKQNFHLIPSPSLTQLLSFLILSLSFSLILSLSFSLILSFFLIHCNISKNRLPFSRFPKNVVQVTSSLLLIHNFCSLLFLSTLSLFPFLSLSFLSLSFLSSLLFSPLSYSLIFLQACNNIFICSKNMFFQLCWR